MKNGKQKPVLKTRTLFVFRQQAGVGLTTTDPTTTLITTLTLPTGKTTVTPTKRG